MLPALPPSRCATSSAPAISTCHSPIDWRSISASRNPDVLHCHSRRGADVLGGLAASFTDVPAVVSRRVDNTEMRLLAALRYRPFKKVIAISEAIAGVLRDRGVENDRLTVIRSSVDTRAFEQGADCDAMRREFGLEENTLALAAVGQLIPRKGHRYLLQALADLRERYPMLRLVVFGEGFLRKQLEEQVAALDLGKLVTFAGFSS